MGETIDIHGGGLDLIFPHHENEIVQSRSAHNDLPLARFWVHNGFVDMGAEKMSKSLGNVITPEELLKKHHGETLRLSLLSAHYRQPLPWTEALIAQSKATLDRLYRAAGNVHEAKKWEDAIEHAHKAIEFETAKRNRLASFRPSPDHITKMQAGRAAQRAERRRSK